MKLYRNELQIRSSTPATLNKRRSTGGSNANKQKLIASKIELDNGITDKEQDEKDVSYVPTA